MPITTNFRRMLFEQDSDDGALMLITLDHASLAEPIRVVLNTENITSRGDVYNAYPFSITRPEQSGDKPPRCRVSIDNVDRQITEGIRSIATPLQVTIETVAMSDLDTVEESLSGFQLTNVQINYTSITGELNLEDLLAEPYPNGRFTPSQFPGGF